MKIADIQALLTPSRIDTIADAWGAKGQSVRFLRALENFVYEFEDEGRPLILRFTHSSHRTTGQVEAELEFVDFLGRNQVTVARAVPSRHGRLVEVLRVEDSFFSAAVFERAPGAKTTLDLPAAELDLLYQDWGALLGSMHRVVPQYRNGRGDPRRHVGIEDDIISHAATYLPPRLHNLLPLLDKLLAEIRRFPTGAEDYGLLHTDCHHGNFHVDGRRLTLFDFDDCCHHWFAYDLAIPVWHFPLKDRGQDLQRDRAILTHFFQEFIRDYQRMNRFQPHWLEQLPLFFRLRDLQLFIFSWKVWDTNNPQPGQHQFLSERGALIESGRASVDLDWAALTL